MQIGIMCRIYAAVDEYRHIAVHKGDPVLLWCNTTKSGGVNWTRNTTAGDFSYVSINGRIQDRYTTRYSMDEHSLSIYNVHIGDSGCYDCYQSGEVRRFGYDLNVTGKKAIRTCIHTTLCLKKTFPPLNSL